MSVEVAADHEATSWDVAKRAGLSRSAVSQILNGHGDRFLEETRDRVRAAADELGYRPSRAARALVNGVSDLIVVVVPHATFGTNLQDGVDFISQRAAAYGLSVFVRFAGTDRQATLAAVLDLRPVAVVDLDVFQEQERQQIVAAGIEVAPKPDQPGLEDLNVLIGRLQVEAMLRRPERHLIYALLADDRLDPFGPQRVQGATEAAAQAGLQPLPVLRVPLDLDGAVAAVSTLGAGARAPLGICCYNDDVALAVLAAARELSIAVPEAIAVIGVDRTRPGQLISPRLTTIAYDIPALMQALIGDLRVIGGATGTTEVTRLDSFYSILTFIPGESS